MSKKEHVPGAPISPLGYVEYKCRCDECTAAYNTLGATPRERRLKAPTPSWVHGTWNGYNNWGCRCARCLSACREKYAYNSAWRKANRPQLNAKQRVRRRAQRETENERTEE